MSRCRIDATFGTVDLQPDGRFSYTPTGPTAGVPGVDSFVYRLSTENNESRTAVVFLLLPDGNRTGDQRVLLPLLASQ